ncbi:hypothetical protein RYX36_006860 [Vicia faba]
MTSNSVSPLNPLLFCPRTTIHRSSISYRLLPQSTSSIHTHSLFRYLIQTRSFNEATLRFLDSLLVSKDVKSLIETRSSLKQLLKSESLSIIHSIAGESIHDKLVVLDFFVHAFALVGDLEVQATEYLERKT